MYDLSWSKNKNCKLTHFLAIYFNNHASQDYMWHSRFELIFLNLVFDEKKTQHQIKPFWGQLFWVHVCIMSQSRYTSILVMRKGSDEIFASKPCFCHMFKTKTEGRGTIKSSCLLYSSPDPNCSLYKLENPDINIKAFSLCPFTWHSTLNIAVSEIYFMNKQNYKEVIIDH